ETIFPQEGETGDQTESETDTGDEPGAETGDRSESITETGDLSESGSGDEIESEGETEDISGLDNKDEEIITIIESTKKYTGVIVADEGPIYILIPATSIEDYDEMYTHIGTESMVPTTVYNIDEATGLALLKIEASRITPDRRECMKVSSFEGVKRQEEGQEIVYYGSVVGNSPMFFKGHISNSGNVINCLDINYSLIITDIMYSNVNDGFIFNDRGNLVGISGMEYGDLQLPYMIAGAKAIDLKYIINNMLNDKNNIYFGIYAQNVSPEVEEMAGYDMPKGIYVKNVVIDSPAYNAGIMAGDVITVVGNNHSVTMSAFRKEIESRSKGDTVQIKVKRRIGSVYNTYNLVVYLETVN
ncbi:MAG: PDZ domain-containing protein, partial [Lachnospiraceae bacterium]|nr:PDZ domain-containing protein [Lachnospiraceae bacterium]